MSVRTLIGLLAMLIAAASGAAEPRHAIAMHGAPRYAPGFAHFDYVNPRAPVGGDVRLAAIGTFDSLNPYILKGVAASGLGLTFDTLAVSSDDEPFTEYGLLARTIEVADNHRSVTFALRPEARFHNGRAVTAADVVWTFDTLTRRGHPFYRAYYAAVTRAVAVDDLTVRFDFASADNRELPLIVGQLPVLPRDAWTSREFDRTTLEPLPGSGPYRVEAVDAGRSITYRRVDDYWGRDLAVNRGRHNFARIRYDYYRDATVALEAFKAGEYDFREENVSKAWATGYASTALDDGAIRKVEIPHQRPTGMQAFVFNTRRPVFADPRVRAALAEAFDFEWTNRNLFYGAYTRTRSFFSNSDLAARGLPGKAELALLEPLRGHIPEAVFTTEYSPPSTDGSGNLRHNLRAATRQLRAAGWVVRDRRLVEAASGAPMRFEILLVSPSFERVVLPFRRNLERLGAEVAVRTVDPAQYQKRLDEFDFDMVVGSFGQSLSPGNEQRDLWGSAAATTPGSRNLAGIRDPAVDTLIQKVVAASDRAALVAATRALDRVLLWGHYVIPQWHVRAFRVAYWALLERPAVAPPYALAFDTWWVDPARAPAIRKRQNRR